MLLRLLEQFLILLGFVKLPEKHIRNNYLLRTEAQPGGLSRTFAGPLSLIQYCHCRPIF